MQVLEKEGKIAKFIPVDFTDAETVFERCMQVGVCVCMSARLFVRVGMRTPKGAHSSGLRLSGWRSSHALACCPGVARAVQAQQRHCAPRI